MRNSRFAAVLGAAAIVVAGVAIVPAGAVTAPAPTKPTTIVTSAGVANTLLGAGVGLQTVGATSMSVLPTLTGAQVGISLPSIKLSATTLAHTGQIKFIHGGHVVTLANLKITVNPATHTGSVSALFSYTGQVGGAVITPVFGVTSVVITVVSSGGHVWTKVVGNVVIPALVNAKLTQVLGLTHPLFSAGQKIATATAYVVH